MALPVTIPNAFANATASIPLSQLDTNFNTLANAVNGISDGSETLANVTATVGNITTVNATTVDTTNIEVTNIKAKDGTAAVVLTDSTGAVAVSTPLTANGGVVFNEAGADVDFRVEGDTDANLLFVDAGNDRVGVGTGTPETKLHNNGTTLLGTGTWPTSSVGNSGSRVAILSSTEDAILIVANTESTVGANKGGELLLGAKATTGTETLAASRVSGRKENATSGNFASYLQFSVSDAVGSALEAARFNSSGNLAFPNGQGIDFSASAGGGASSSVLDDYEEGTFTPNVTGVSTAGTTTYTSQFGFYTKIGRQVFVVIDVAYSAATGTGGMQIQMPFAAAPISGTAGVGSIMTNNLNWTAGTYLTSYLPLNTSYLVIYGSTDDGAVTQQNMTNEAVNLWLSISYIAT